MMKAKKSFLYHDFNRYNIGATVEKICKMQLMWSALKRMA